MMSEPSKRHSKFLSLIFILKILLLLLLFLLLSYSASTRICLLWSARKEFGHEKDLKSQMYRITQGTPVNKVAKRFQINRRQLFSI